MSDDHISIPAVSIATAATSSKAPAAAATSSSKAPAAAATSSKAPAAAADPNAVPVILGRFRLGAPIGNGAFGQVFVGYDVQKEDREVAIKLENVLAKHPQLRFEAKVYYELRDQPGVPKLIYYGTDGQYNVLVIQRLGHSLEHLFRYCGHRFSLKTVLLLADQMLQRLETLHNNRVIHRDLKPDNFVFGLGKHCNELYLIDFGLSKCYVHPESQVHIPFQSGKSLIGTPRYASVNNHRGIEQSRRDDLEALAYLLLYFLCGRLPWQDTERTKSVVKGKKQTSFEDIAAWKERVNAADICPGAPKELIALVQYSQALGFYEKPDYERLRAMLSNLFDARGFVRDNRFDWTEKMFQVSSCK
jgi:casein kinase 1